MAATKEIMVNGVVTEVTEFYHSAQEIDDATARALEGGVIDQLLAVKAPDGYGLGSVGRTVTDLDDAQESGFYSAIGSTNLPPNVESAQYGSVLVLCSNADRVTQVYFQDVTGGTGAIAVRRLNGNGWSQWEFINPPMRVGVEYRTTERYNGKPVYTKIISFGNLPNNTTKDIIWAESGIVSDVIHASVITSNGALIGGVSLSGAEFTATRTNIYIKTTGDYSSMTALFLLKYTKMTD